MEWYYILMLSPALIVTLYGYNKQKDARWQQKVTTKELCISLGANFLIALLCLGGIQMFKYGKVSDYYILNGKVTGKYQDVVSCEHSYKICTTSNKATTCRTYYEHSHDYDWVVKTTLGNITIDRVDRQGVSEPKRYSDVIIGEPAAKEVGYNNYLFADPESLFVQNAKGGFGVSKAKVYDYYRTKHFLGTSDYRELELPLKQMLVGKNFNLTFVVVKNKLVESFYDLLKDWQGGKINEVTFVVNKNDSGDITWVKGNSYAKGYKNQLLLKTVEDLILSEKLTLDSLKKVVDKVSGSFILHTEQEFEEKIDLVEIPLILVLFLTLINLIVSIGIHIKMKETDL